MFQSLLKIYDVTKMGLGQEELLRPGQNGGFNLFNYNVVVWIKFYLYILYVCPFHQLRNGFRYIYDISSLCAKHLTLIQKGDHCRF
jgi:hypothetical protein